MEEKVVKICIAGAAGRMGRAIAECAKNEKDVEIAGLLEAGNSSALGETVDGIEITSDIEKAVSGCGCVIDFTTPDAVLKHISSLSLPFVIGTTGFSEDEIKKIAEYAQTNPVVFSPNMSLGVNVLFSLAASAASALADYDIEIIETHHNKKKDSPSGTAKKIAATLMKIRRLEPVYGREGLTGARKKEELGIHAVRAGDIVGEHRIVFAGSGESVEISHRAYSRNCFAAGAVAAAKWVAGKTAGLYGMGDVLGLKK